mmetsp:Transcript_22054/g.86719  ORF Transcript_22054/g.86719 Transcript_22054/m.86719 type:complete len:589 (-) Transcript_22054:185-1951(-)
MSEAAKPWYVQAHYNWEATKEGQVPLVRGGIYCVTQELDHGWSLGIDAQNNQGFFPTAYTRRLTAEQEQRLLQRQAQARGQTQPQKELSSPTSGGQSASSTDQPSQQSQAGQQAQAQAAQSTEPAQAQAAAAGEASDAPAPERNPPPRPAGASSANVAGAAAAASVSAAAASSEGGEAAGAASAVSEGDEKKKKKSKSKVQLGVSDGQLAKSIDEDLGIGCVRDQTTIELLRGIRQHFAKFIKEIQETDVIKSQLGLSHSYSRSKIKFNINRADNHIIQTISILDQLDKDINTFAMRVKEWYSWHFPELARIVNDNIMFARAALKIGNKSSVTDDAVEGLEELLGDEALAKEVVEAARTSMGTDISDFDMLNVSAFAKRVVSLGEYRQRLHTYLVRKMAVVAPNLAALIGELVAARLIAHAGSLTNLAKYPASTVQILGAEKALFRALKTKSNTPKYGIIFHATFIGRAAARDKGRISRCLANKCSLASRIDSFSDVRTAKYGEMLREQVEDRLKFYDSGVAPKKNVDVMMEAKEAVEKEVHMDDGDDSDVEMADVEEKKEKKKSKKRKRDDDEEEALSPKKKKSKKD